MCRHRGDNDVETQRRQGCADTEETMMLKHKGDRNVPTQTRQGSWKHTGIRDVGSQWGQECCLSEKTGCWFKEGFGNTTETGIQTGMCRHRGDRNAGNTQESGTLVHSGAKNAVSQRRQGRWFKEGFGNTTETGMLAYEGKRDYQHKQDAMTRPRGPGLCRPSTLPGQ